MSKQNTIKAVCTMLLSFLFVTGALAQSKTVTGEVFDDTGESIPGATIMVKGTSDGTISKIDGSYSISGLSSDDVLIFSVIGMLSQEIAVANQSVINVTLKEDAVGLEEIVVVGFGEQKKATLTGAVTQVKGAEMIKGKSTSSAALAMQGEVPGLVITRTSARPGNEGLDIKIRGDISVNNISPLILLDGLEIPEWQLSTMNSNDIESMSVIKDGAAAIYGTKAAGGVILITTKRGKVGEIKVEYNGDLQFNYQYDWPIANMQENAKLWVEAGKNDALQFVDGAGTTQTAGGVYKFWDQAQWEKVAAGEMPTDPLFGKFAFNYADTDYFNEIYGTTTSRRHNVSISGGNEKATYRTSLGYANERSTIDYVYDGAKKYNFRTNLTYDVNDIISTDFNISYDNRKIDVPSDGVGETLQDPWFFPLYNPDGQFYHLWGNNNILAQLKERGRTVTEQEVFRLGGTINADLEKYIKGLSFRYMGNISSRRSDKTIRKTTSTVYNWDGTASITNPSLANTSVNVNLTKVLFQNHVFQANYKRSIGDNNFALMTGITAEETDNIQYNMFRKNMSSDALDDLNTGDVTTQTNGGTSNNNDYDSGSSAVSLLSYIGRLNYDYAGIYLVEASGRRDGSSRLHPDFRWKNFYGGSAGIRLSEMGFLKDGLFQNLKLRASYGETGSTTGIGAYDYFSTIGSGSTYFGAAPSIASTAWISGMTTTERTWERVAKTNYGVDFATLNSRLSGSFEFFQNQNKDMLISITYPQALGATAPKTNSGDFNTNGWELTVNWRDKVGEVRYNFGVMLWDSQTEVTRMEGATTIKHGVNGPMKNKTSPIEGRPLNAIYAYKTDGLFQNEDQVLDFYNKYHFIDPADQLKGKSGSDIPDYRSANRLAPGSYKKVDVSGDGVINEDDLYFFGDANPHYSFGINLGLEYKNWDFSAFFQGVGQQYIVREGTLAYPFRAWYMNQNNSWIGETWTPDNTGAESPAISLNGKRKGWNYGVTNDANIIKASYMRAKVLSLGYTLPNSVLNNVGIERMRLSASANDLFTISNVRDGLDPENASSAHNGNVDPFNSTLLFNVQITF